MIILSMDPGLINLGYCVMEFISLNKVNILNWGIIDLELKNIKTPSIIIERIIDKINDIFRDINIDIILIEYQPICSSSQLKTVSVAIHSYFSTIKKINDNIASVKFVTPVNKLKCKHVNKNCENNYKNRKLMGIDAVIIYIDKLSLYSYEEWFKNLKKKDDAADSFLYCINYLETQKLLDLF